MKNLLIIVLLAASVALGALYFHQAGQITVKEARITELETVVKTMEAEAQKAAAAEKRVKELRSRLNETTVVAAEKSGQVAQLQRKLATAETNANKGKGMFGEMFKSPEMRKMIADQQKMVLGPMVEKNYAAYFQQMNLDDQQKGYLKDLLQKKMLVGASAGVDLLNSDLDQAKREEIGKKIKDDMEGYDAQIKQFLGDANYPQFEAYEKSIPDRMQLGMIKDQMAGGSAPITGDQEQQLLQIMADERTSFKWTTDYSNQSKLKGDMSHMADMFSEDKLNTYAEEKAQYDQLVLSRARTILSEQQYASFEQSIAAQRELQVNQMKMAAKMFGAKGK